MITPAKKAPISCLLLLLSAVGTHQNDCYPVYNDEGSEFTCLDGEAGAMTCLGRDDVACDGHDSTLLCCPLDEGDYCEWLYAPFGVTVMCPPHKFVTGVCSEGCAGGDHGVKCCARHVSDGWFNLEDCSLDCNPNKVMGGRCVSGGDQRCTDDPLVDDPLEDAPHLDYCCVAVGMPPLLL